MALLVVSIISPKGGSMKTTTALNLIARLVVDEQNCVLLDCDSPQHSSTKRNLVRKQNGIKPELPIIPVKLENLKSELLRISREKKIKIAIVELGAKSEEAIALAAAASAIVIITLKGSSLDTDTIETIKHGLADKPKDTQVVILPSMVKGINSLRYLQGVAKEVGIELTKTHIKDLDCYISSFDDGSTIFGIKPKTKTEKGAVENFEKLYQEIFYG